jgi:GT2 family glycosyltransferase
MPWHSPDKINALKRKKWAEYSHLKKASESTRTSPLPIFCYLDHPLDLLLVAPLASIEVSGWALSFSGILSVVLSVDEENAVTAQFGQPRPDVARLYSEFVEAESSGFTGAVHLGNLLDGTHILKVSITAMDGSRVEITREFTQTSKWIHVGNAPEINNHYEFWLRERHPSQQLFDAWLEQANHLRYRPSFTIVAPPGAFSSGGNLLESIRGQAYDNWDVWFLNPSLSETAALSILSNSCPQIHVASVLPVQAPFCGWADVVARASGEFILLLDDDGRLSPNALLRFAHLLNIYPTADLLYSDDDRINATSDRWDPFFKPDWSPDLLLSKNYLAPLYVYRKSLLKQIGSQWCCCRQAESYDYALRVTELSSEIYHVPEVLFSRFTPNGPEEDLSDQGHVGRHCIQLVLEEAMARRKQPATVEHCELNGCWRVRYTNDFEPEVALIVPTGGRIEYLRPFLESVFEETTYKSFHVLLVDNSGNEVVQELFRKLKSEHTNLHYLPYHVKPFNYSAICNYALRFTDVQYIVFLNDDMTIKTGDWIQAMLEHASRPEVGVVGAKLLFPNDTIQHAGVILGPCESSAHAFRGMRVESRGYFGLPHTIRNCSAVTFACAMMRRSVYNELGGLDIKLCIAFQDVDMCLRLQARGYRVLYTPYAVLYHHESVTKEALAEVGEAEYMQHRWGAVIAKDPFYNPNLSRLEANYSLNWKLY